MKQIKFILTTVLLLSVGIAFANTVSQDIASIVAKNWYNEKQSIFDAEISNVIIEEENSMMMYYVFNFVDGGYIIVSAENNAPAVLGYSSNNSYQEDNHPPQFDLLLGNYKQQITAIIDENLQGTELTVNEWSRLSVPIRIFQPVGSDRNVDPLIESHWGQGDSWNDYCPADASGPGGNALVGCAAVAQAQIMRYWEHPSQGLGSNSYYHSDYGTISANFGTTTYNWSNMPNNSPTNYSRELLFHCGVGVNMDYGPNSSGAYPSAIDDAMEDYFYYNSNSTYKYRSSYNEVVWEEMLRAQLDDGKPIIYNGWGSGGHSFNLDGYEGSNHFHFNWGWNGSYDDYFYLSDLTPGTHNYNDNQTAIFDLIPAARVSGHVSLAGGSGNVSYVDVDFERISTGEVYSFYPDANGDFGDKNLPTGSYNITYSLNGYRDYVMQYFYINAALLNVEIPDIELIPIMTGIILVKLDGTGDFTNISQAVQAAEQSASIFIFGPGTYTGENNKNISWNGNEKHLYIRGANNPVIDCENDGRVFTVNNGTEEDIIQDLTIINTNTNYCHGGAIKLNNGSPKVINNTFENCKSGIYPQYATQANGGAIYIEDCNGAFIQGNMFDSNSAFSGGALYIVNSSLSLTYNTFLSNASGHILDGTDGSTGIAGAVHIENCYDTNISNNLFEANFSNHASAAMAIVNASDNTIVELNTFNENIFGQLDTLGEYESAILGLYYGIVECRDNLFTGNTSQYGLEAILDASGCDGNIINNSFINNTGYIWKVISFGYYVSDEEITNCLFLNNDASYISIGDVTLTNCNTYQSGDLGNDVIEGEGCFINIDPLLDANYKPQWSESQKSPCIDTGNPDSDNDGLKWYDDTDECDADGSRRDIGAIPAITHNNDAWKLPYCMIDGNLKWISFPSTDITVGNYEMYNMMEELINPDDVLEYVVWKEVGSCDDYTFELEGSPPQWTYPTYPVTSPQGFKMQMREDCYEEYVLEVSGQLADSNTPIPLLGEGQENWIGYFLEKSMDAKIAFAGVWDNLYKIKTQYWSMARIEGTNTWISGLDTTLEYGDMVVVHAYDDCTLIWNDGEPQNPKEKRTSENFDFTEEPDYVPIYVAVDPEDDVQEIGVLIDGVCKGAAVVQSEVVDINAYIVGNTGEVEFVKYYGDRSPLQTLSEYVVFNPQSGQNELGKIELSQDPNYYFVSFREDDANDIPPAFNIVNFPNPFNPSTTINYSIPNDTNVKLCIFNVKGQKVTTLVKEAQTAGSHNAVWNGTDNHGKKVSSGIYFYKIVTEENTEMKKMLLLK